MRGILSLQVALGLAALFAVAYLSAERLMAPVETAQLERAAGAEASSAAQRISSLWDDQREAARTVVRTLAGTPAFRKLKSDLTDDQARRLKRALEGARTLAGGGGQAAALGSDGRPLVETEGAESLAASQAAQAALRGRTTVIVEAAADQVHMVAAAPIGDRRIKGVVVIGRPLRAEDQAAMLQAVPAGISIAVQLDKLPVFGTLSVTATDRLLGLPSDGTVELEGRPYRAHRVSLSHDGRQPLRLLTLAALRSPGTASVSEHFRILVLLLGFGAVLVVLVGSALEPAPALETASRAAPAEGPAPVNLEVFEAASADLMNDPPPYAPQPAESGYLAATPSLQLKFDAASPSTKPMNPSDPELVLELDPSRAGRPSLTGDAAPSSTEFYAPSSGGDGDPGLGEVVRLDSVLGGMPPAAPPPLASDPVVPENAPDFAQDFGPDFAQDFAPGGRLRGSDAIPLPPPASEWTDSPDSPMYHQATLPAHPAPGELPPDEDRFALDEQFTTGGAFEPPETGGNFKEPTPFDAIARAAFTAPPPAPSRPEQKTDLPAPKGPVSPELMAAQRAEAQRLGQHTRPIVPASPASYDPNLPAPKGATGEIVAPSRLTGPSVPARRTIEGDGDRAGSDGGASDAASSRDPWRNPSVPRMPAPSARPEVNDGPAPYDEAHYRSVYQQFIASKEKLGESVENLTYDGFRSKLRNSEESLLDRHGCRAVRFQVLVKDRTVSLRPQLVR